MAGSNSFDGDLYVNGTIYASGMIIPANSVTDAKVAGDAAIAASKLIHAFRARYAAATTATAAAAVTQTLYVARGNGTIKATKFAAITAALSGATVTIDIKKNGTSVLTGTFQLTDAVAARALVSGTIDPAQSLVVAGDEISVVMTVAAGGGTLPAGVYGYVDIYEAVPV